MCWQVSYHKFNTKQFHINVALLSNVFERQSLINQFLWPSSLEFSDADVHEITCLNTESHTRHITSPQDCPFLKIYKSYQSKAEKTTRKEVNLQIQEQKFYKSLKSNNRKSIN